LRIANHRASLRKRLGLAASSALESIAPFSKHLHISVYDALQFFRSITAEPFHCTSLKSSNGQDVSQPTDDAKPTDIRATNR
jgi:hypothetical protein